MNKTKEVPDRFVFKLDMVPSVAKDLTLSVTDEVREKRLDLCRPCERRDREYCTCCACPAGVHARRLHAECWLGKW